MPEPIQSQLPLVSAILSLIAVLLLIAVLMFLYHINTVLTGFSKKLTRTSRSTKLAETEDPAQVAEVDPGTPFEKFLKEDPERLALSKREKFKGYRLWRKERGLNWGAKNKKKLKSEKVKKDQANENDDKEEE
ncbi:MAG: hypothetical protein AB8D78_13175 [Akkermansiaceae bacterium]